MNFGSRPVLIINEAVLELSNLNGNKIDKPQPSNIAYIPSLQLI